MRTSIALIAMAVIALVAVTACQRAAVTPPQGNGNVPTSAQPGQPGAASEDTSSSDFINSEFIEQNSTVEIGSMI